MTSQPLLLLYLTKLVETKKLNAGQIIREVAKLIDGGGGGQPFLATLPAEKKPQDCPKAIEKFANIYITHNTNQLITLTIN